jgi:uncharacterized protein (DUF58 family)
MAEPLLGNVVLRKLEQLALRTSGASGKAGNQQHWHNAGGVREFIDHRSFYPGDDLRRVNWRAYLRSETLMVKLYRDDLHAPTRILLDCSRSMMSGSRIGEETKFTYGKRLTAALLYMGLVRLESTVIQPFSSGLGRPARFTGGRHIFASAERYLVELRAEGGTDYARVAAEFLYQFPAPGLTVVISDFLGEGDCLRALQSMMGAGHDLRLIQLSASEERSLPRGAALTVIDVESRNEMQVLVDDESARLYAEAVARHSHALRTVACSRGGNYVGLQTTTPVQKALFGAMVKAGMVG